eukprot:6195802-Pleurochrysis_carterae.AAC.2
MYAPAPLLLQSVTDHLSALAMAPGSRRSIGTSRAQPNGAVRANDAVANTKSAYVTILSGEFGECASACSEPHSLNGSKLGSHCDPLLRRGLQNNAEFFAARKEARSYAWLPVQRHKRQGASTGTVLILSGRNGTLTGFDKAEWGKKQHKLKTGLCRLSLPCRLCPLPSSLNTHELITRSDALAVRQDRSNYSSLTS